MMELLLYYLQGFLFINGGTIVIFKGMCADEVVLHPLLLSEGRGSCANRNLTENLSGVGIDDGG